MRVLLQSRPDVLSRRGGDTVQMERTAHHLERLGAAVTIGPTESVADFDLVHVFNIQTAPAGLIEMKEAAALGIPVVLSPIYWDLEACWSSRDEWSFHRSAVWRLIGGAWPAIPAWLYQHLRQSKVSKSALEMLSLASRILPNSYAEAEILARVFGAPWIRPKIAVVPNGVDLPVPKEESADSALDVPSPFLLEVGRLEPAKGQRVLLLALMDSPEIPLVFLGRASNPRYAAACRALGRERGNTWFVEEVPHERVGEFYSRCRVHALPSFRESPGLASLEAGVRGANCVVSIHGPVSEYFGDEVWYCDPANVGSVRRAALAAWEAPRSNVLTERIQTQFTWQNVAAATHREYERLLDSTKATA